MMPLHMRFLAPLFMVVVFLCVVVVEAAQRPAIVGITTLATVAALPSPVQAVPLLAAIAPTPFQTAVMANPHCKGGLLAELVPFHSQETAYWCWAASGQMVMEFSHVNAPQCVQATAHCLTDERCDHIDCCLYKEKCKVGGIPDLSGHGLTSALHPGELKPDEIVQELGCNHRPFLVEWLFSTGGGHMMVATDFKTDEGEDFVVLNDPDYGPVAVPYADYQFGYSGHGTDIVQIKRAAQ